MATYCLSTKLYTCQMSGSCLVQAIPVAGAYKTTEAYKVDISVSHRLGNGHRRLLTECDSLIFLSRACKQATFI